MKMTKDVTPSTQRGVRSRKDRAGMEFFYFFFLKLPRMFMPPGSLTE
jgi:hypothetical protein